MKISIERWWLLLIVIILVCIMTVLFVLPAHRMPAPASVIIMSQPYTIPTPKVGLLDRVMPRSSSWAWLWRVRYALFGQTKSINLNSTFMDLTGSDLTMLTNLLPAKADFVGSDGLRVWKISQADVSGLKQWLKETPERIIDSARVTMGDKTECGLHSGTFVLINGTQRPVGVTVNFLPYIRKDTTDLTAIFGFSEAVTNHVMESSDVAGGAVSIRTHLAFVGRFQLSKKTDGIFVLPAAPPSTNQKRIGLILTSEVLPPKKPTVMPVGASATSGKK